MKHLKPDDFVGREAWDALNIERFDGATVRLHWTDKPYEWHVNDGPEVFVLLSGAVQMHYREGDGAGLTVELKPGDVIHCAEGDAHMAEPLEPSRVLVIERPGSI